MRPGPGSADAACTRLPGIAHAQPGALVLACAGSLRACIVQALQRPDPPAWP